MATPRNCLFLFYHIFYRLICIFYQFSNAEVLTWHLPRRFSRSDAGLQSCHHFCWILRWLLRLFWRLHTTLLSTHASTFYNTVAITTGEAFAETDGDAVVVMGASPFEGSATMLAQISLYTCSINQENPVKFGVLTNTLFLSSAKYF